MKRLKLLAIVILIFVTGMACTRAEEGKKKAVPGTTKGQQAGSYDRTKTVEDKKSRTSKRTVGQKKKRKRSVPTLTEEQQDESYNKAVDKYEKAVAEEPDDARSHYSLGITYAKGDDSSAAEHLHKAGLLFLKKGKRINALKSYEALKQTDAKELAQDLYEKLHPSEKQAESESSQ